jgi:hypothetical protein
MRADVIDCEVFDLIFFFIRLANFEITLSKNEMFQLISRDESVSRLQMQLQDIKEELVRKDTELHSMEVGLVSSDECRKRLEDQVQSILQWLLRQIMPVIKFDKIFQ